NLVVEEGLRTADDGAAGGDTPDASDAADDYDKKGPGKIVDAHLGDDDRQRRDQDARNRGDRRAGAEGNRIDPLCVDAKRLGHVAVLNYRPEIEAEACPAEYGKTRSDDGERRGDQQEPISRIGHTEDGSRSRKRAVDALRRRTEEDLKQLLEHQAQAPGRED